MQFATLNTADTAEVLLRALVFDGELRFCEDYPMPKREAGFALVRVETVGICNTDLEIVNGYADFTGVLGHEFVGTVADSDETHLIGCRVVGEINISCDDCEICGMRLRNHCESRRVIGIRGCDGAFAEYLAIPDSNLHVVPPKIPNTAAVFTEPLAAAYRVIEQVTITPEMRVAVLGDGKLGLLVAQVIATKNERVVTIGRHKSKLALLKGRGLRVEMADSFADKDFDLVIEATGSPAGIDKALKIVRPCGTIVMKTTIAGNFEIDMSAVVVNEIRIIGSRCGPFPAALQLLSKGAVDVDSLITGIYPFESWRDAFRAAISGDSIKVLMNF